MTRKSDWGHTGEGGEKRDEVARKVIQSEVNQIEQIANLGVDEFCGVTLNIVMLHIFFRFGHY